MVFRLVIRCRQFGPTTTIRKKKNLQQTNTKILFIYNNCRCIKHIMYIIQTVIIVPVTLFYLMLYKTEELLIVAVFIPPIV